MTANGYKVLFPAYGNVEEVPLEYLQKKVAVSHAKVGMEIDYDHLARESCLFVQAGHCWPS